MSDDGTLAPGKFYAGYPLWVVYDEDKERKSDLPHAVQQVAAPDIGRILPIFTDTDLMGRFLEALNRTGKAPCALRSPEALLKVLEQVQKDGVGYVGIDLSFQLTSISANLHPIGEFIEDVRRSGIQG
jgi:hypothetical protein